MEGYLQSLKDKGVFEEPAEKDTKEPPTAYLWALYFLAQHYDYRRNTAKAFKYINEAIEHTPTMVELYMTKGRILKVGIIKGISFIGKLEFMALRACELKFYDYPWLNTTSMGAT